jgi:hypothetical protein
MARVTMSELFMSKDVEDSAEANGFVRALYNHTPPKKLTDKNSNSATVAPFLTFLWSLVDLVKDFQEKPFFLFRAILFDFWAGRRGITIIIQIFSTLSIPNMPFHAFTTTNTTTK